MLAFDAYPTTRVEVGLRLLLLSAIPIMVALLLTLTVRAETLVLSLVLATAAIVLVVIGLLSVRLWRAVPKAANARATEIGAELVCPVTKFTLIRADGSVQYGGKGWCLVIDDAIMIEEADSRDLYRSDVGVKFAMSDIQRIAATRSAWTIPRILLKSEDSQITFEVMNESGSPYFVPSRATLENVVDRFGSLPG